MATLSTGVFTLGLPGVRSPPTSAVAGVGGFGFGKGVATAGTGENVARAFRELRIFALSSSRRFARRSRRRGDWALLVLLDIDSESDDWDCAGDSGPFNSSSDFGAGGRDRRVFDCFGTPLGAGFFKVAFGADRGCRLTNQLEKSDIDGATAATTEPVTVSGRNSTTATTEAVFVVGFGVIVI